MPFISKIQLPSGTVYDIKPTVSINFVICYKGGEPTAEILVNVPSAAIIKYDGSDYQGTLSASVSTYGSNIYLVKSNTQQSGSSDIYDEWVTVDNGTSAQTRYTWEKLGDTRIGIVDVTTTTDTASKVTTGTTSATATVSGGTTDTVIGSDATFSVTQPTISVTPSTTYIKASASGGNVAWNSKDSVTAVTGVSATTTNIKATASGANTAWNSKDQVTAVTGVTATKKKLTTTTVTGVSGSTNITPIESRTSQTTADGTGTESSTNTDWLKGVSVSNETLIIGAATLDTQTTYSAGAPRASLAVPTAASNATTVATGGLSNTSTTTNVGETIAIDASASSTDTVIGSDSTFTITQPTVALSTGATAGTGVISVATGASASSTDTVIGTDATFTVTQPTVSLATDSSSATGRVQVATGISSASASGGAVAWGSKDQVNAVTSVGTITTTVPTISKTDLTVVTSVTPVQDEQ